MRFEETRQHLVGNSLIQSAMSPLKDANFWSRPVWMLSFFACNKFRLGYNSARNSETILLLYHLFPREGSFAIVQFFCQLKERQTGIRG